MIVVSDSTPLITLMKAGVLHILKDLFGEVIIPESVYEEVTGNDSFQDEAVLIKRSDYIKVVTVQNQEYVKILQRATGLDLGESEAIIYADEAKADLLLMDESAGRKVAMNMKIPIAGSVGILVRAFKAGILTTEEAETAFERIRNAGRYISDKLFLDALQIIHEEDPKKK